MPRNSPPPYIAAASSSSPRCLSVSSLKQLSPNPFSESTTDSHEKHSPTTPVNKFSQSQVNLLGNRISQLIQMMEAESPSEGAETGKPVVGHKKVRGNTSKFRRLLGWKPFKRFRKLRGLRREKYSTIA